MSQAANLLKAQALRMEENAGLATLATELLTADGTALRVEEVKEAEVTLRGLLALKERGNRYILVLVLVENLARSASTPSVCH